MDKTIIHLVISVIGMLLGYSAFICFCMVYFNIEAGVWALFSGIKASVVFILHYNHYRNTLHARFSRRHLDFFRDIGFIGCLFATAFMIYYIFLEFYWREPAFPVEKSIIIRIVWSFMWSKWALLLHYYSKNYQKTYNDEHLFNETPNIEET